MLDSAAKRRNSKDLSRRLELWGVNMEPRLTMDDVVRMLDTSPTPRPIPQRFYWPHSSVQDLSAFIEFSCAAARNRAFSLLHGRTCGPRFLAASPSTDEPKPRWSELPLRPRLKLDWQTLSLSKLERLQKACGEADLELCPTGLE